MPIPPLLSWLQPGSICSLSRRKEATHHHPFLAHLTSLGAATCSGPGNSVETRVPHNAFPPRRRDSLSRTQCWELLRTWSQSCTPSPRGSLPVTQESLGKEGSKDVFHLPAFPPSKPRCLYKHLQLQDLRCAGAPSGVAMTEPELLEAFWVGVLRWQRRCCWERVAGLTGFWVLI